jgi:hypothetical protein
MTDLETNPSEEHRVANLLIGLKMRSRLATKQDL